MATAVLITGTSSGIGRAAARRPAGGYYHASTYAVEALTDALRFEAAPFGIAVTLIEPGLIRTGFGGAAAHTLAGSTTPSGPYAALTVVADRQITDTYGSGLLSAPPEAVATVIARVFDAYLRTRYRGTLWAAAPGGADGGPAAAPAPPR